jgi:hypothetical protein
MNETGRFGSCSGKTTTCDLLVGQKIPMLLRGLIEPDSIGDVSTSDMLTPFTSTGFPPIAVN